MRRGAWSAPWAPYLRLQSSVAQPHVSCSLRPSSQPPGRASTSVTRWETTHYVIWPSNCRDPRIPRRASYDRLAGLLDVPNRGSGHGGGSPRGPGQRAREWRLRLRVGLRNEEAIEFDARSLPDDTIPLTAPRDISLPGTAAPSAPAAVAPAQAPAAQHQTGQLMRFARIGVLPQDRDITAGPEEKQSAAPPADPTAMRYGVLVEIELVWQSLGAQAGDTLYSISLGPGEEVKLAVSDGRWRKSPDARERPLQIVAKMVGARQIGDGMDAMPLAPCVAPDLPSVAADTVKLLAERTARTCEALRRRALGVTELEGEKPAGTSVRTLRNMRSEGVLTYHFVEPI